MPMNFLQTFGKYYDAFVRSANVICFWTTSITSSVIVVGRLVDFALKAVCDFLWLHNENKTIRCC